MKNLLFVLISFYSCSKPSPINSTIQTSDSFASTNILVAFQRDNQSPYSIPNTMAKYPSPYSILSSAKTVLAFPRTSESPYSVLFSPKASVISQAVNQSSEYIVDSNKEEETKNFIKCHPCYYDKFEAEILTSDSFHGDEVSENAINKKWIGLFKNQQGIYYLFETPIEIHKKKDSILDGDSEQTGKRVSIPFSDSVLILIGGVDYLKGMTVKKTNFSVTHISPKETITFKFLGKEYSLKATGHKQTLENYKLFLSTKKDGVKISTLLCAQPFFDDKMIEILFMGDLDGDDLLDLIIDTSPHYNAYMPTVYLSSQAEPLELVKIIGMGYFVGC